jgi:hypothetical protein
MYAPPIIQRSQERLEAVYRAALPHGLVRHPVAHCESMARRLANAVDAQGQPARRLTPEEDAFIANERLLTKIDFRYWVERYVYINAEGTHLQRFTPLWESQEIILGELARLQQERTDADHPDGLLVNILKARQLGASTLGAALITHRVTVHTHVRALLASDVPENSGSEGLFGMYERIVAHLPWFLHPTEQFHKKDTHIIFTSGSAIMVESGKSMKGGLQEKGAVKGGLGRSRTYSTLHLTELSSWDRGEQIDDSLMPAVPRSSRTLAVKESTAKGRHNWHHEDWLVGERGHGRFTNVFIPWYAEVRKNWLPAPPSWTPDEDTVAHARKASEEGPKWLHRPVVLTREQLRWYEEERAVAVAKNQLAKFLEEQAADPESAFQHSGRSIFGVEQLQYLAKIARPMIDCWAVQPAAEISAFRAEEIAEIRRQRDLAVTPAHGPSEPLAGRVEITPAVDPVGVVP